MTTLEFDEKIIRTARDLGPTLMDYLSTLIPNSMEITKEADANFVFGYEYYLSLKNTDNDLTRIWAAEGVKAGWVSSEMYATKFLRRGANALRRCDSYFEDSSQLSVNETFVRAVFRELYGVEPEELVSNPYSEKV